MMSKSYSGPLIVRHPDALLAHRHALIWCSLRCPLDMGHTAPYVKPLRHKKTAPAIASQRGPSCRGGKGENSPALASWVQKGIPDRLAVQTAICAVSDRKSRRLRR